MSKKKVQQNSLKNLIQSNQESNHLTRESLETALLYLLQKKDLRKISITELVQTAGVSRNAFYRNYKSKEEILSRHFGKTTKKAIVAWQALQDKVQLPDIQQTFSSFLQSQKKRAEQLIRIPTLKKWVKDIHLKK